MNLHEEQERVQKAVSNSLSHVQEDPWLTQRVLANAKGEKPMKRKISLALVLGMTAILAVVGTAYALTSSLVADFFGKHGTPSGFKRIFLTLIVTTANTL